MSFKRRSFLLTLALVATLLTLSVASVPAIFGQETTPEVTPEPIVTTTALPESTEVVTPPEITPPAQTATPAPEQTTEATAPAAPETTAEATAEATGTPTPLPTDAPTDAPQFTVISVCTDQGTAFVITNNGPDMGDFAEYVLITDAPPPTVEIVVDDATGVPADEPTDAPVEEPADDPVLDEGSEESVDAPQDVIVDDVPTEMPAEEPAPTPEPERSAVPFMLASGESLTVEAGYGAPRLQLGDVVYEANGGCAEPLPVLGISAVCTFETGVEFTISNSSGPMEGAQPYSITSNDAEPVEGAFLLAANEQVVISAGYGLPVFTGGDLLLSALDEACLAPAEVRGVIWDDANGDGVHDEGEIGLTGVTIHLIDPAGFSQSFVSGFEGGYWFGLLQPSTYTVEVDTSTLSSDYSLSFPADTESASVTVNAQDGDIITADFGFAGTPTASLSGIVWLETGNFGVRDASEMGVAGVLVELVDYTGAVVAASPVDLVTGEYTFSDVLAGEYIVRLAQGTLFTPNFITWDSDGDFNYEAPITLATSQALTDVNFGVVGTF